MIGILGEKVGMTHVFSEKGELIPVTVIKAGPCFVVQKKEKERDGYEALQVGYGQGKAKNFPKPLTGHFQKASLSPLRFLREFRVDRIDDYQVGQEIKVNIFNKGDIVNVQGYSKGRGFTGVVKRHGFRGGPRSHGQSDRLRAPGSIGGSSFPSRVFPGTKMAGRMGMEKKVIRNLKIIEVVEEDNLLLVKGSVPGRKKGVLVVTKVKEGKENKSKETKEKNGHSG